MVRLERISTTTLDNTVDKLMKSCKIDFSMQCFTVDFLWYSSTKVKICLLVIEWVLDTNYNHFLETKYFGNSYIDFVMIEILFRFICGEGKLC